MRVMYIRAVRTTAPSYNRRSIKSFASDSLSGTKVSLLSSSQQHPSPQSTSSSLKYYNNLRRKTLTWLDIPDNSWSLQDASMGRSLMREWSGIRTSFPSPGKAVAPVTTHFSGNFSSSNSNLVNITQECATHQTKMLCRWIRERKAASTNTKVNKDTRSMHQDHAVFREQPIQYRTRRRSNSNISDEDVMKSVSASASSQEMVEMLNRCLDSWRNVAVAMPSSKLTSEEHKRRIYRPQLESMKLIDLFHNTGLLLNDKYLLPHPKTYSLCMNVLSLYPESSTACDDVLFLYKQCCDNWSYTKEEKEDRHVIVPQPDLQFYNVCLHTLANFGSYHPVKAPKLVERIFQEMTTNTGLIPNTTCFVSLLHVWTNTITRPNKMTGDSNNDINDIITKSSNSSNDKNANHIHNFMGTNKHRDDSNNNNINVNKRIKTVKSLLSAADRVEAILEKMTNNYPHLVDVICFNICINAWAKQGYPERAEKVLLRLIQIENKSTFNNTTKNHVDASMIHPKKILRPNVISFNSTINAWAKSCSSGNRQVCDPPETIKRVELLLEQMKLYGVQPTSETFASVMEVYSNASNLGVKVEHFLEEIESMYQEGTISSPPSKICYLHAIQAWSRTKISLISTRKCISMSCSPVSLSSQNLPGIPGAERAEYLLRKMEEISSLDSSRVALDPCVIIYTAVITAWSKCEDTISPVRALSLFRRMCTSKKDYVHPNVISLNALLTTFCNHDRVTEAQELLEQLKQRLQPNKKTYQLILRGYAKSKSTDAAENAHEFLKELEYLYHPRESTANIKPTVYMYSQVLTAWGNSSRYDAAFMAEELFLDMIQQKNTSVLPDTVSFNCVLRAWSKSFEGGAAERAESFLRRIQQEYDEIISIDSISHLHMIYAWAFSRRKNAPLHCQRHLEAARKICSNSRNASDRNLTKAHYNGVILAWSKSDDKNASRHIRTLEDEMNSLTV